MSEKTFVIRAISQIENYPFRRIEPYVRSFQFQQNFALITFCQVIEVMAKTGERIFLKKRKISMVIRCLGQ